MVDIYSAVKKKRKPASKPRRLRKKAVNPLAAFMLQPDGVRFETQEKKEKIILLLRKHWITNLSWISLTALSIFIPFLLRFFPILGSFPFRYQLMAVFLWYLLTLGFCLQSFLSWYFNVNIITDERIVDIDFYSLIYKQISHCKIDKIQDISFTMGGVVRTFFNYGDVLIQTAGEIPVIEFQSVPQPALVVRKLNDLILEEEQEKIEGRVR